MHKAGTERQLPQSERAGILVRKGDWLVAPPPPPPPPLPPFPPPPSTSPRFDTCSPFLMRLAPLPTKQPSCQAEAAHLLCSFSNQAADCPPAESPPPQAASSSEDGAEPHDDREASPSSAQAAKVPFQKAASLPLKQEGSVPSDVAASPSLEQAADVATGQVSHYACHHMPSLQCLEARNIPLNLGHSSCRSKFSKLYKGPCVHVLFHILT